MTRLIPIAIVLAFVQAAAVAQQSSEQPGRLLWSFESPAELAAIVPLDGASVRLTTEGVTQGKQALSARYEKGTWPSLKWFAPADHPWDWSQTPTLAFDVYNPGDRYVDVHVRADDGTAVFAPKMAHVRFGAISAPPHFEGHYFIDLSAGAVPVDPGMKSRPPWSAHPGLTEMPGIGSIVPAHIVSFELFVQAPQSPVTLILDNIRLLPPVPFAERSEKLVDRFGQFANAEWPGKVHRESELRQSLESERHSLNLTSSLQDRDEYGGWAKGPQLRATGNFTTLNRDGRWWFVDPLGHLFWAIGVDGPAININETVVTGREAMFEWLPGADDPLVRHLVPIGRIFEGPVKSGRAFDFYCANLQRKFGPDYVKPWSDETLARMKSWGLNSMSGWRMDLAATNAIPFMQTLAPADGHIKIPAGGWGPIDDPWDPQFAVDVWRTCQERATPQDKNPMCIGFMMNNEMSWGGGCPDASATDHFRLAMSVLSLRADSPAKQYFISALRLEYTDIGGFNAAWGVNVSDWQGLLNNPFTAPAVLSSAAQADSGAFLAAHSRQWFRVVHDELKNAAPHKLFLGCRFSEFTPEAVAAAAEYCDAVSFNIYHTTALDPERWGFLKRLGKPVIVTEWHFGATDRGMFGGGMGPVTSQAARASSYREFAGNLLDNPVVIGEQWYQYTDQPLTGRTWDGENYNIGFVTVTDEVYPELVSAARTVHLTAYTRHSASH
ncbi:MAG: hypothetical protein P4L33_07580 [Capsulimonadaceae bacterium]|nr:hypothetical protein [Capsulimonadaceae bacterium]